MTFWSYQGEGHGIAVIQSECFMNVSSAWTDLDTLCDKQEISDSSSQSHVVPACVFLFLALASGLTLRFASIIHDTHSRLLPLINKRRIPLQDMFDRYGLSHDCLFYDNRGRHGSGSVSTISVSGVSLLTISVRP